VSTECQVMFALQAHNK